MSYKHDIAQLEKGITDLNDAIARLNASDDLLNLLKIIKNPGWTTVAEFLFASSIVETMQTQVQSLEQLKGNLLKGSLAVSEKAAVHS